MFTNCKSIDTMPRPLSHEISFDVVIFTIKEFIAKFTLTSRRFRKYFFISVACFVLFAVLPVFIFRGNTVSRFSPACMAECLHVIMLWMMCHTQRHFFIDFVLQLSKSQNFVYWLTEVSDVLRETILNSTPATWFC